MLLPLWNAWYFFTLYANADGTGRHARAPTATGVLDRYILAKTAELVATSPRAMDAYDLSGACDAVHAFLDALTNWYIRRSRDRFWARRRRADAFDTLLHGARTCSRRVGGARCCRSSPRTIYRGLTGERSVHLDRLARRRRRCPADAELVAAMDRGARRVLGGAVAPQGQRPAGAPAAGRR